MRPDHFPLRQTALWPAHVQLGAKFTPFAGWSMPLRYVSEVTEHHAVRQRAGLFDLSHMGQLEVSGPEAGRALDYALVGHLSAIDVGGARYTMLCHDTGGILDDLVVYRLAEHRFLVVANASNAAVVLATLRDRADGFTTSVEDRTQDRALIAVQGPNAAEIVSSVVETPVEMLRYYAATAVEMAQRSVILARTGYTGEDGFEIFCHAQDAAHLWQTLLFKGAERGLQPAGLACRDTLRLEAGMPLYGNELHVGITPFEAGLGRVVAFGKPGDFVGRAALAEREVNGPHSILVGLVASGRRAPRHGHAVIDPGSGERIGLITSGAPSPTLGHPVAMAYVPAAHAQPETSLHVDIRGTIEPVAITSTQFYRRSR
jgi:aminomethyltransferase